MNSVTLKYTYLTDDNVHLNSKLRKLDSKHLTFKANKAIRENM